MERIDIAPTPKFLSNLVLRCTLMVFMNMLMARVMQVFACCLPSVTLFGQKARFY
jgi:hypothetical protein